MCDSVNDPQPHLSWLATPQHGVWPTNPLKEPNPFIAYRKMLWSWHRAMDAGWSDGDFIHLVRNLDAAIGAIDGHGFVRTPASWVTGLGTPAPGAPVFVKDETHNVSGSHKARHLMGQLLHLAVDAVANDQRLAIASCGNAALGAATVARAAGRPIDVFIPTWADSVVVGVLSDLNATIHVCERRPGESGDPCMLRFREAVGQGALAFGVQSTENPWTLDGGRTIGWEFADQVAGAEPDLLFVQVGGGALLTSTAIGLLEAVDRGPLASVPSVWAVQAEGCAPFDRAWTGLKRGGSIDERIADAAARSDALMQPWIDSKSVATGILDDVTYDWLGVARALLTTGGESIVASESEIVEANRRARDAGFDVDHTGSAGYAGVLAAQRTGRLPTEASLAVIMTGVRRSALGWGTNELS